MLSPGAFADEDRGTLSLQFENDALAGGTDRNYTSGARIAYLTGPDRVWGIVEGTAGLLLGAAEEDVVRFGFALGQSIFTPDDIRETRPLPDQHPYAGWLYADFSILVERKYTLDTLSLQVGVVGPDSGAEWVQTNVHEWIHSDEPRGWDNQLQHEPGVVLTFDRKWRALAEWDALSIGIDLTPNAGFSVGNVLTQATAGLTLRIGNDLADDYGPPRIRPSLAGGGFFKPSDSFGWYIFAGAAGRAVAYNIFLDGNTMRDSLEVDRRPFVLDVQVGVVIQLLRVQLAFTVVGRTEEFESQRDEQVFGAVSLSFKI
ncbi:MAG: lipid A deacylase LpxR family protein [Myxococcales bacterium]|nr:lipid A deacylase LpxR family protein [Myxococcales bacterium]